MRLDLFVRVAVRFENLYGQVVSPTILASKDYPEGSLTDAVADGVGIAGEEAGYNLAPIGKHKLLRGSQR